MVLEIQEELMEHLLNGLLQSCLLVAAVAGWQLAVLYSSESHQPPSSREYLVLNSTQIYVGKCHICH